MARFKVTVKPVEGEVIVLKKFDSQEEADRFKIDYLSNDSLLTSTPYESLIVITESLFSDEWVEISRDYMMR